MAYLGCLAAILRDQWVVLCASIVDLKQLEVHLRPGLGAEVIATAQADWFNAQLQSRFLAIWHLDFAASNTPTIDNTNHNSRLAFYCPCVSLRLGKALSLNEQAVGFGETASSLTCTTKPTTISV